MGNCVRRAAGGLHDLLGLHVEPVGERPAHADANDGLAAMLDAALAAAMRDAAASGAAEPVVLLSPACASYDQFRNFEVRGDAFREIVRGLPGVAPSR